jgi:hypothetical protein
MDNDFRDLISSHIYTVGRPYKFGAFFLDLSIDILYTYIVSKSTS